MNRAPLYLGTLSAPFWVFAISVICQAQWADQPAMRDLTVQEKIIVAGGRVKHSPPDQDRQWHLDNGWIWDYENGFWYKPKPVVKVAETTSNDETYRQARWTGNPRFPLQRGGCVSPPPTSATPPTGSPPPTSNNPPVSPEEPPAMDPVDLGPDTPPKIEPPATDPPLDNKPPATDGGCACGSVCKCKGGQNCQCGNGCKNSEEWHSKIYNVLLENHNELAVLSTKLNDLAIASQNHASSSDVKELVIVLNRLTGMVATKSELDTAIKNQTQLLAVIGDLAGAVQKADTSNQIKDLRVQINNLSQKIDQGTAAIIDKQDDFAEAMSKLKVQIDTIGKGQAKFRFTIDPVTKEIKKVTEEEK